MPPPRALTALPLLRVRSVIDTVLPAAMVKRRKFGVLGAALRATVTGACPEPVEGLAPGPASTMFVLKVGSALDRVMAPLTLGAKATMLASGSALAALMASRSVQSLVLQMPSPGSVVLLTTKVG